jgi:hypothetical protein
MNRLALNMIVGPGDAGVLLRLFSSIDMRKLFDEIVLIRTTNDQDVIDIINCYADKTNYFEWSTPEFPNGNFGEARDMARKLTNSEWIMWLDSDDMLSSESDLETVFNKIKKVLSEHTDRDYFVCPYILTINPDGSPENVLSRERIFKRESTIKWMKPVHEQLTINTEIHKRADLTGLEIVHCPMKDGKVSALRNLKILTNEYLSKIHGDRHMAFYYARDSIQADMWRQAVPVLVDFINTFEDDLRNVYEASLQLARFFLYKQGDEESKKIVLCQTTSPIAEKYARMCIAMTDVNAEPFSVLGDIYISQKRNVDAIKMFKTAMSKKFGTGSLQDKQYYEKLPAKRLAELYIQENELEQALWYNKVALKHDEKNVCLIDQRKKIVEKLYGNFCQG